MNGHLPSSVLVSTHQQAAPLASVSNADPINLESLISSTPECVSIAQVVPAGCQGHQATQHRSSQTRKKSRFHFKLFDIFHHTKHDRQGLSRPSLSIVSGDSGSSSGSDGPKEQKNIEKPKSRVVNVFSSRQPSSVSSGSTLTNLTELPSKIVSDLNVDFRPATTSRPFHDRYRFADQKILGRGASGIVKLACCDSGCKVAVKEFRKRRRSESQLEYARKVSAEYCIASMMHHCNIVETIDIIGQDDRWYEIMEYCSGGDLFRAVQSKMMAPDEIDCCFRQMIEGVAYLHSQGVAHRDLKPENILIATNGYVKITDFGVATIFHVCWEREIQKSHGICGSSPYIAPEEYTQGEYDARAVDVWALGIIYYAMVYHGVPWETASTKDLNYRRFLQGGFYGFDQFRRLPFGPRAIIQRMLEPDPLKRITIEELSKETWFQKIRLCYVGSCSPTVNGFSHHTHGPYELADEQKRT